MGLIHLGAALHRQGNGSGIAQIENGIAEAQRIGAERFDPLHLSFAAQAYSSAGQQDNAAKAISSAFASLANVGDVGLAAELHRVRAATTLAADASAINPAKADLVRALEIARNQQSIALELRAARGLAKLLADRGDRAQAFDLLDPVLSAFTEGFETPDLVETAALLDALR